MSSFGTSGNNSRDVGAAPPIHSTPPFLRAADSRSSRVSFDGSRATSRRWASAARTSFRTRRPSHPSQSEASSARSAPSRGSAASAGNCTASSVSALSRIFTIVSRSGNAKRMTRSARERNASSTASMKLVVVTKSTDGSFFAISSIPRRTASVARWTSTGFASKDAVERRTAKLSTSSTSTTVKGRRAAISGTVSVRRRVTFRWLSPSMSLGNACGFTSTSVVAPVRASARAATCASPRAIVVLPVPGGPASTINPCGRPESIDNFRPCSSTRSACARRRSFTARGTMIASQSRS